MVAIASVDRLKLPTIDHSQSNRLYRLNDKGSIYAFKWVLVSLMILGKSAYKVECDVVHMSTSHILLGQSCLYY